jgi:hypothetical protein
MRNLQPFENISLSNDQVLIDIQSFFLALDSYPDRFAKEPEISFEQHLYSVASAVHVDPRDQN